MKRYIIKVDGLSYEGLFASTWAAIDDAMERYPESLRVSARVA